MIIHYKDLPELNEPASVFVEDSVEDAIAWQLQNRAGLIIDTIDITGVLEQLKIDADLCERTGPEVCVKFCADAQSSALAESVYWRGGDMIAWDLTHYEPGIAPIPEHVISTPEIVGLLTVGGAADPVRRSGNLWCDATGDSGGWPSVALDRNHLAASIVEFSERDLGVVSKQYSPGRIATHNHYWRSACVSRDDIMSCVGSAYPHTARFADQYRRSLRYLRLRVSGEL